MAAGGSSRRAIPSAWSSGTTPTRRRSGAATFLLAETIAFGSLILIIASIVGAFAPAANALAASSSTPALTLTPPSGLPGTTVTASGTGYGHNVVQLVWDDAANGLPQVQATGSGTFRATFRVPAGAPLGTHLVSASVTTATASTTADRNGRGPGLKAPGESASVAFVVQVAALTSPTQAPQPTVTPTSAPTAAPTAAPTIAPTATPLRTVAPTSAPTTSTMSFSYYCISRDPLTGADDPVGCKPNTQGWDSSIIEIPPYYRGRTSPRGGIVEQQTPGYASQTDSRLWVINPPAPSGNPYPWCVWDADDRVRGDLVGLLPAGGSFSVTLCFIADVNAHRASMSLVEYPQLSGSITFGEFMTLPVSGGRSACVVGAQYRSVSDPRLAPISNTNYPAVGRYEYVTFTVTNTTTASANIVVPTVIGRYLEGIPSQSGLHESRWCPGDTADVGGPSIWQYGNWLYTPYDVSMGTQPAVWWKN